jgi:hypothetical protein
VTFFELFQPGLKYLREEKERQRMLVSKPTHGGGAPLGIDLDAGTAKITIRPKTPDLPAPDGRSDDNQISADVPSADDATPVAQRGFASGERTDESAG